MRRGVAAVALAALVGAALVGCSSGTGAGAATSDGTASPSPTDLGPAPTVTMSPPPGLGPSGEAIAPPTTPEQERFIEISQSGNADPGSVLEAGIATCDRAAFLVQIGEQDLVDAIANGSLALADTAIPLLCPDRIPQLLAARGGFGDGETTVRGDVKAGRFAAPTAPDECSWTVVSGGSTQSGSVAEGQDAVIDLVDGARVTSTSCGAWLPAEG